MPVEFSTEQEALRSLNRSLKNEADGKVLRRDLSKNMRGAVEPVVSEIKAGVMAVGHGGMATQGEPLRPAVAKKIKAEARLTGKQTGARIRARKVKVRGFENAPKRLNQTKGWRHPVFGGGAWVTQMGNPNYWDDPIDDKKDEYREAVIEAMDDMAGRIVSNVRRR